MRFGCCDSEVWRMPLTHQRALWNPTSAGYS